MPTEESGRPLVVLLHGCTQNPRDFAAGTRFHELAQREGVLVLYPGQAPGANPRDCWNWFLPGHQQRGQGEPGWIAALTQSVIDKHRVDPDRVFIGGMSAGAAMAALVLEAYPELYAAAGLHSGLPARAARSVLGALGVMKGLALSRPGTAHAARRTIVFHGDKDNVVHPRNCDRILARLPGIRSEPTETRQGRTAGGREFTHKVFHGAGQRPLAEQWIVHGSGHGWSGGSPDGSHTDPSGPDASAEMLRFFLTS